MPIAGAKYLLLLSWFFTVSGFAGSTTNHPARLLASGALNTGVTKDVKPAKVIHYSQLLATITPLPNSNRWNTTTVTVHFAVTNISTVVSADFAAVIENAEIELPPSFGTGIIKITPDIVLSNDANSLPVLGVAVDQDGHSLSNAGCYLNIDKTPPRLKMEAGNAGAFDDSFPLLVIDYSDPAGVTNVRPSGLNLDSFQTTLDGMPMTNQFFKFSRRAFAMLKHLAAGPHLWVASIADAAGNVTTVSNSFTATGTINTNAPAISHVDLTDEITMVPEDLYSVWVQGKIDKPNSAVSTFVNDEEVIKLNQRDDDFGQFVSLGIETNLLVVIASDATGGNRCAKLFKVARAAKYEATLNPIPARYGDLRFTNGKDQAITGTVSLQFNDGQSPPLTLVSVKVNGLQATFSQSSTNDLMDWRGITLPAPGCTNSIVPIILNACWSGQNGSDGFRTVCVNAPLEFMEGYEIVEKESSYVESWVTGKFPSQSVDPTAGCGLNKWIRRDYTFQSDYVFNPPCAGGANSQWSFSGSAWTQSCWQADTAPVVPVPEPRGSTIEHATEPNRGLAFGEMGWQRQYTRQDTGDQVAYVEGSHVVATGSMTIRTPFCYKKPYVDIFTFKGIEGNGVLSNLFFEGNAPFSCTESNRAVFYILELDGATEYTISQDSFTWAGANTNVLKKYQPNDKAADGKSSETYSEQSHFFRFSDFDQ